MVTVGVATSGRGHWFVATLWLPNSVMAAPQGVGVGGGWWSWW